MLGFFRRWRKRRMATAKSRPMTLREMRRELTRISAKAHRYDQGIRECGFREIATSKGYKVFTSQEHLVDDGLGIQVEVIEGDDLIEVVTKVRKIGNDRALANARRERERDGLYSIEPEDGSADKQKDDLIAEFEKMRNG